MITLTPDADDQTMRFYNEVTRTYWRVTMVTSEYVHLTRLTRKGTDYARPQRLQVTLERLGYSDGGYALSETIMDRWAAMTAGCAWAPTSGKIEMTAVLGAGAFRVCLATTDPTIAVKIGYGNDDELAMWNRITSGGTVLERDGIRIPRMRRIEMSELDYHPDHVVPEGSRDRCKDAASSRANFPLAVERVPGGRRVSEAVHQDWGPCDPTHKRPGKPCEHKCVYKRVRAAFPMLRDMHGGNIMIDKDGTIWVVDIAM